MHSYIGTRRELHVSGARIKCIIQKKVAALEALAVMYLKLVFVFSRTRKTASWYQPQLCFLRFLLPHIKTRKYSLCLLACVL